jgi:hypothetical protein
MAKVVIKSENITPYGGIFYVMDIFSKLGLGKLIESTLGQRGNTGKSFQYSEILSSVFYSYFCGADYLEDINTLAPQFSLEPCTVHPSSDTVGRGLKELSLYNSYL